MNLIVPLCLESFKLLKLIFIMIFSYNCSHAVLFADLLLGGFPGGSVVKNPPTYAGDTSLIFESGSFPGEGNSNPLQYSCLGNPMDRRA